MSRPRSRAACIVAAAALLPLPAFAQGSTTTAGDYPLKPVRVIVSFAPGGATDIVARVVAQKLSENMERTFVVENHSGAGGVIGDSIVAKAAPDGYTLLATSSTYAINPAVIGKLPYDPIKNFAPITLVAQAPFLLVVHPSVPATSVKDLVALARRNPGKLDFASAGKGTAVHLAVELFSSMARITMTHIPYKGTGPALVDLLAGQVQLTFGNILSTRPYAKSGKLRALAVSSAKRSTALPELPTVSESGVAGYDVASWYAWLTPAGTPQPVVQRLNAEIIRAVRTPEITQRLASGGAELVASTPEQFGQRLTTEIARWRKLVKEAGVRPE